MTRNFRPALASLFILPTLVVAQEFSVAPMGDPSSDVGMAVGRMGPADSTETPTETLDTVESEGTGEILPLSFFTNKPFRFTVSVREGYDDNVLTSRTNRIGSFFTNFAAGVNYSFGSPRLKLSTNLTGGLTYYYRRPGNKVDLSALWNLAAVYSVSPRMTVSVSTNTGWYSQPAIGVEGAQFRVDADYLYSSSNLAVSYQWTERFSTVTRYNARFLVYDNRNLNNQLGNVNQTISQSFDYLFWPTTTVVAEYRANPDVFFDADTDSFGQYFLLGFNHTFNPRSFWNLRAGAELRLNNNPVDGSSTYIGPFVESIFTYKLARRSDIAWSLRYGTENSGVFDVTQAQVFRTGLSYNQGLTAKLLLNVGAYYTVGYYDQPGVIQSYYQNAFEGVVGLRYDLNRIFSLSAGYRYSGILSQQVSSLNYSRNVVFVGLNANF
jgi:hypothetical protein